MKLILLHLTLIVWYLNNYNLYHAISCTFIIVSIKIYAYENHSQQNVIIRFFLPIVKANAIAPIKSSRFNISRTDTSKFTRLEAIYVLNGKVYGAGVANRDKIIKVYVGNAKKITALVNANDVLKYGGIPSKNIIILYETYKNEQEKQDSLASKRKRAWH